MNITLISISTMNSYSMITSSLVMLESVPANVLWCTKRFMEMKVQRSISIFNSTISRLNAYMNKELSSLMTTETHT